MYYSNLVKNLAVVQSGYSWMIRTFCIDSMRVLVYYIFANTWDYLFNFSHAGMLEMAFIMILVCISQMSNGWEHISLCLVSAEGQIFRLFERKLVVTFLQSCKNALLWIETFVRWVHCRWFL